MLIPRRVQCVEEIEWKSDGYKSLAEPGHGYAHQIARGTEIERMNPVFLLTLSQLPGFRPKRALEFSIYGSLFAEHQLTPLI